MCSFRAKPLDTGRAFGALMPAMTISSLIPALFALALSAPGVTNPQAALPPTAMEKAGWTLVTGSEDVYIYTRVAEGRTQGPRRVWTAYDSAEPRERDGFTFRSVKSLGEFDCKRNLSRVVDETYHDAPALSGKSWKSPKFKPTPWAASDPDSVGAIRMAFACKALSET